MRPLRNIISYSGICFISRKKLAKNVFSHILMLNTFECASLYLHASVYRFLMCINLREK